MSEAWVCSRSQGHPPGEEDLVHVERSAEILLRRLKEAKQYSFRVGFAHSFEFDNIFGDDVGPGGIGALIFEINENMSGIANIGIQLEDFASGMFPENNYSDTLEFIINILLIWILQDVGCTFDNRQ